MSAEGDEQEGQVFDAAAGMLAAETGLMVVPDLGALEQLVELPPAQRNPVTVYLARLAPGSRRAIYYALRTLVAMAKPESTPELFPWHLLRYQHTAALRAQLAAKFAPSTANRALAALSGVLKECWRLGSMTAEEHARAVDYEPVGGSRLPAGRPITPGEMRALFAACDRATLVGARDAAILGVLYGGGLRRDEVAQLIVSDLTDDALRVLGKGNKQRWVPLPTGSVKALADWLEARGPQEKGIHGPMFTTVHSRRPKGIGGQGVLEIVQRIAARASVPHLSPHDFRRTFASDLLDAGADIVTVQRLLGHADPRTTEKYDRRGDATKRKAIGLLHIPLG